jgi:hypothetical protein
MKTIVRFSSAFAAAFAGVTSVAGAATVYVAPSGDNSNGQSWATACHRLDTALARAEVGDAIWVKQGTYSVGATLQWKNAVDVYGGFAGTEDNLDQRSKDASLTVLDGGAAVRVLAAEYDLTIETTWSGFTIQNGKVTPAADDGGGGVKMRNNAILDNCIVQNNEMASSAGSNIAGGGILICPSINAPDDLENPGVIIVRNCKIRGNKSQSLGGGGGIFIGPTQSDYYTASVYIQNSEIINNYAKGQAGAIASIMGVASAKFYVENCVIANNYAETNNGGAVFINHKANNDLGGGIFFNNCTVVNNKSGSKSYGSVGGIYINNNALAEMTNCVFWGNRIPDFDDVTSPVVHVKGAHGQVKLLNCAFDGQEHGNNVPDENKEQIAAVSSGNTSVKFRRPTDFAGNAATDDELAAAFAPNVWAVEEDSKLVDAGRVIASLTFDMVGATRYTDGSDAFDIGAYEYVKEKAGGDDNGNDNGDDNGNGSSTAVGKTGKAAGPQIFAAAGSITVRNNENPAAVAYVYDLSGALVKALPLGAGDNTIAVLPQKIYIVKAGQTVQKVLVGN